MALRITPSIPALQTLIAGVDLNTDNLPKWEGTHGLQAVLYGQADILRDGRILCVTSDTFPFITGADAAFVLVENIALYRYEAAIPASLPVGDVAASGGGSWRFLAPMGPASYSQIIGDSITDTFVINHGLKTLCPTVLQVQTLNGLPYSYSTLGTVTVIDQDSVQVAYQSAPGSSQFTIVVKK